MRLVLGKMNIKKLIRICFLKCIIPYCCWCITCKAQHGSGKTVARYSYRTSAEEQRVSVLCRAVAPRWREIWCNGNSPGCTLTCSTSCIRVWRSMQYITGSSDHLNFSGSNKFNRGQPRFNPSSERHVGERSLSPRAQFWCWHASSHATYTRMWARRHKRSQALACLKHQQTFASACSLLGKGLHSHTLQTHCCNRLW